MSVDGWPGGGGLHHSLPPTSLGHGIDSGQPRAGTGIAIALLVIVAAGALAHVGVRLKGLEVAYALGQERRLRTELEEQQRRLQIEIGMLKDPGRIVSLARELGMGPPAPEAIWRIGSGTLAAVPSARLAVPSDVPPPGSGAKDKLRPGAKVPKRKLDKQVAGR